MYNFSCVQLTGTEGGDGTVWNLPTKDKGARLDAKLCPTDPRLVSFTRAGDLYVVHGDTYEELRLTHSRTGNSPLNFHLPCA